MGWPFHLPFGDVAQRPRKAKIIARAQAGASANASGWGGIRPHSASHAFAAGALISCAFYLMLFEGSHYVLVTGHAESGGTRCRHTAHTLCEIR